MNAGTRLGTPYEPRLHLSADAQQNLETLTWPSSRHPRPTGCQQDPSPAQVWILAVFRDCEPVGRAEKTVAPLGDRAPKLVFESDNLDMLPSLKL